MRRILVAAVLLLAVLLPAAPAGAITNGTVDGAGHPARRRAGLAHAVLRRHLALLLGHADLPDRLPHRRALRRGGRAGGRHVRSRLRGRRQGLLRHLPRRPALPRPHQRRPRHRRRRPRPGGQGHHAGPAARGRLAVRPLRDPAVHLGRLRRLRGDERSRRPPVPLRRRADGRDRHAERDEQDLAAHLDERVDRQRRHLLRRLRRPELPRDDANRRGDHHHRRRRLPLDERRLPAGHGRRPGRSSAST